jgi:hypothetical protein
MVFHATSPSQHPDVSCRRSRFSTASARGFLEGPPDETVTAVIVAAGRVARHRYREQAS